MIRGLHEDELDDVIAQGAHVLCDRGLRGIAERLVCLRNGE